jgi:TLD
MQLTKRTFQFRHPSLLLILCCLVTPNASFVANRPLQVNSNIVFSNLSSKRFENNNKGWKFPIPFSFSEDNENKKDLTSNNPSVVKKDTEKFNFQDKAYDPDDPVEAIFGFFFGKREAEPMGMKRFGSERFPEQYPATTTEWANPVSTDTKDMALIRPLLKNTNLETRALKLTYDANRNGWSATAFHKAVDKLGGGIVVCKTSDGLVCGGYNPKGWVGYGEARGSIAAFLFVFPQKDNTSSSTTTATTRAVKLRKVGGPSLAQQDLPELGPCFGADSLVISLGGDNPKQARSKLGSYYERFSDGTNTLFKSSASVQLVDLKVYHGVYGKDEYIPFTDAEPFALY